MDETARGPGDGAERHRLLGIYLNDHLAGATSGVELARRMAGEYADSEDGEDLANLAREIARDREALLGILADLQVPARRYKVYGAWVGERLARAKPNGRLLRRSALTPLIEVEALRLGVQGKVLLWSALRATAADHPRLDADRLDQLRERAERQLTTLDAMHARVASGLLAPRGAEAGAAGGRRR